MVRYRCHVICERLLIFIAAALTAGMAAYLLGLAREGNLKDSHGNAVSNSAAAIMDHMISTAWSRGNMSIPVEDNDGTGTEEGDVAGIYNSVDLEDTACRWSDGTTDEDECDQLFATTTTSTEAMPTLTRTSTSTTSTTSTTTTEAPEPTVSDFLKLGEVVCNDEADFQSHADVSGDAVEDLAGDACYDDFGYDTWFTPDSDKREVTLKDGHGVQYRFSAWWIEGCENPQGWQWVYTPLSMNEDPDGLRVGDNCAQIYDQSIYHGCKCHDQV